MSGGVDSSVAAALLLERGYRVEAASLRLWDSTRGDGRICSDHREAGRVAAFLGIAHTEIDERAAFERRVVAPFVAEYAAGRTPNPCVACNRDFKLGTLFEWAIARGASVVATGHYARVETEGGRPALRRGIDARRDQSYFLFALSRRQLERVTLPLGEWTKEAVRGRARSMGLPVADKLDSQDLCFGDPAALVRARLAGAVAGEIVDETGARLGGHAGVEAFTVGQRRGLGIATGVPLYVREIRASESRIVVGAKPPLSSHVLARDWSWIDEAPAEGETLVAQVRYHQTPVGVRLLEAGSEGRARVVFAEPVVAAPGQALVVYRGDQLLGGGWIERAGGAQVCV